ncbi:hypothetical protein ME121_4892 [Methylobacterium sp. ME121]|nr:hypothetical protein ME121_4892 [Methylobacterium sp. ME121]
MTDQDWSIVAAIGQAASAVIAAITLPLIFWQVREARKAADLQSLETFFANTLERESTFLRATIQDDKFQAFAEYLNFLECQAAALNGGILPKVSRELVRDKVIDALALIEAQSGWHAELEKAILTPNTFTNLTKFIRGHRKDINKAKVGSETQQPSL